MSWYYSENQTQQGPVDDNTMRQLIQEGRIHDGTYLWRDGFESWKFFSEIKSQYFPNSANPSPEGTLAQVTCVSCSQSFNQNDCLSLSENRWVCAACKSKVVQQMKEGVNVAGTFQYAGFWIRFGAKFIDSLIQMIVTIPASIVITMILPQPVKGELSAAFWILQGVSSLFSISIAFGYNTFLIGKYGATWGKMALGLKVIRPDGSHLTYGRAFGRYAAEFLSSLTLLIGYIMAAFDNEKRALHDRVADTRVVLKKD